MQNAHKQTVTYLNQLIQINNESQDGYRTAAQETDDTRLQTFFNRFSQERAQFSAELQEQVRRLGGDVNNSGTVLGDLHQAWMKFRSAISSNDDEAMIAEAIRGEEYAIEQYSDALSQDLPDYIERTLNAQLGSYREALTELKRLEPVFA